ncbi:MAG: GDSL-type esterase/lipase family protein [Lentisphaeria bacterium]
MRKNITIVGFGDSITEAKTELPDERKRWLNLLGAKLARFRPENTYAVINAGIGGNSAREAMARLDRDVLAHHPDIVLLEFGGNNNDPTSPERQVTPAEFTGLLQRFKALLPPQTSVIVITFPPVWEDQHVYWRHPQYKDYLQKSEGRGDGAMGLDRYRDITRVFAREHGFPLFDLHQRLLELGQRNGRERYTLPDGVHLTEEGNRVLADGVFEILERMLTTGPAVTP